MLADEIGEMLVQRIREELDKTRPKGFLGRSGNSNASGALRNSLGYKVVESGDGFAINITSLEYLGNLNNGRSPGKMPPVKVIEDWVKTKKLTEGKKTRQLAWAISISIKKKGIRKTGMVEEAVELIWNEIVEKVGVMNAQFVEETVKIDLDNILPKKAVIKL